MSTLEGYGPLQARLAALGHTETLVQSIIIHAVADAAHIVPVKTGNLRRTIRPGTITATEGQLLAGGERNVGYARDVEQGTRPHVIRPVRRKALAWGGPRRLSGSLRSGAQATTFATIVHHPGTRAHPYLVPGLQKAVDEAGVTAIVKLWDDAA
jgi:hypothetical protein